MTASKTSEKTSLMKGILTAHFILVLHILVIAGLGLLVIFFRGIVYYMVWIFLFGLACLLASAYFVYRRMKKEHKTLQEILSAPFFQGRSVEISFFGGLASIKIGNSGDTSQKIESAVDRVQQLEDPSAVKIRRLAELARLLETDLISLDEFNTAKDRLFES